MTNPQALVPKALLSGFRPRTRGLLALLVAGIFSYVCFAPAAHAQSKPPSQQSAAKSGKPAASASKPVPGETELQRLYLEQHAATQSGDPAKIKEASRKLSAAGLREMANLYAAQGSWTQAIDTYRQSLQLEDKSETRMDLALACLYAGKPEDGLKEIDKVLGNDSKNARAWLTKGKLAMVRQDYPSAVDAYTHSLSLKRDADTEYALALALLNAKQKEKADAIFAGMIKAYGDKAVWHVVFGGAYRETLYLDDAMREFEKAIAMDPSFPHVHYFLAITSVQNNNWGPTPLAEQEYKEEVRQFPSGFDGNLALGVTESELGNAAESTKYLLLASKSQPDNPDAWLYLGLNAYKQQDYPNAKTYLLSAVRLTGNDEGRNGYQIKRAYFALGRILVSEGNKAEADQYLARYKDLLSKNMEQNTEAVGKLQGSGQGAPEGALSSLPGPRLASPGSVPAATAGIDNSSSTSSIELTPDQQRAVQVRERQLRTLLSTSFNDWGTAEARQKDYASALSHFHQAEKWDDSTAGLMRNIGLAALKLSDDKEALRALQVAVQKDPQDQLSAALLGMSLFSAHQFAEAAKAFSHAGDAVYRDPRMGYAWAFSLVRSDDQGKAVEVLKKVAPQPMPTDMQIAVGDLFRQLGDYEDALRVFQAAIQQDPAAPLAHYYAGETLIRLDRPNEAIPQFEAELKLTPDDPNVQYHLAFAMLQTSRKDEAVALLKTVTAAHPDHAAAQYQLGKALLDSGDNPAAIQHLEVAARLDPSKDYIHYQLQSAYRKAGRTEEADSELKIYRDIKAQKRDAATPQAKQ